MKIAFVSQFFDNLAPDRRNSVGLVTARLAEELSGRHQVSVLGVAQPGDDGSWTRSAGGPEWILFPASPVDRLAARAWPRLSPALGALRGGRRPPLSSAAAVGAAYRRRLARLEALEPDVVHVAHATQLLGPVRRAAPRALVVLHAHAAYLPQMSPSVLARRMAHADLVVTCSDFVGRASEALVPGLAGRWTTVHNGVDAAAAARPGRRPGPPYLLYVGALSPHKGVHDAVAAFAQLAPRFPDLELHLVGPDGLYPPEEAFPLGVPGGGVPPELVPLYRADYAERLTEGLPSEVARRVRRVGWLDDRQLAETFAGAEAFVFTPVWDEGFGLPALEAMAAGTPAVVTRSGGLPEVVADGVTGAVVDKSDPGAVARAVEALLTDPERRRRSSEAARARAATFDWAVAARRLEAAYEGAREAGRAESRLVG